MKYIVCFYRSLEAQRKSSVNRSSFHRWVISRDVKHYSFSLISYWLWSSAWKIKLQMLKFF